MNPSENTPNERIKNNILDKFNNLTITKKIIYIFIALLLISSLSFSAFYIFNNIYKKPAAVVVNAETANSLKTQAMDAIKAKDTSKAKTLLQQAKQQYESLKDTDNIVDVNVQLYIIDHPK